MGRRSVSVLITRNRTDSKDKTSLVFSKISKRAKRLSANETRRRNYAHALRAFRSCELSRLLCLLVFQMSSISDMARNLFKNVKSTQESIQKTSKWIMQNKQDIDVITRVWSELYRESKCLISVCLYGLLF